jgi:hypothetical protein
VGDVGESCVSRRGEGKDHIGLVADYVDCASRVGFTVSLTSDAVCGRCYNRVQLRHSACRTEVREQKDGKEEDRRKMGTPAQVD